MILINVQPAQLLQLLASTIFPLLIGLITTRDTNPGRRAILLALLSVLTSLAAALAVALQTGRPYDLVAGLLSALVSFLIAVGMHFGLWSPTGAAAIVQGIGSAPAGSVLKPALTPTSGWPTAGTVQVPAVSTVQAIPGTVLPLIVPVTVPAVPDPVIHDPSEAFTDPARPGTN